MNVGARAANKNKNKYSVCGIFESLPNKNNNGRDRTSARAHLAVSTAPVFALRAAKYKYAGARS